MPTGMVLHFETEWPQFNRSIVPRVPGSAVFLADTRSHTPPVLVHYVERSRSLHETVVLLQVIGEPQPEITSGPRSTLERLGDGFCFVAVREEQRHGMPADQVMQIGEQISV